MNCMFENKPRHKYENIKNFKKAYSQSFADMMVIKSKTNDILDFYGHEFKRYDTVLNYKKENLDDIKLRIIDGLTQALNEKTEAIHESIESLKNHYKDYIDKLSKLESIKTSITILEDSEYSIDELCNFTYINNHAKSSPELLYIQNNYEVDKNCNEKKFCLPQVPQSAQEVYQNIDKLDQFLPQTLLSEAHKIIDEFGQPDIT